MEDCFGYRVRRPWRTVEFPGCKPWNAPAMGSVPLREVVIKPPQVSPDDPCFTCTAPPEKCHGKKRCKYRLTASKERGQPPKTI